MPAKWQHAKKSLNPLLNSYTLHFQFPNAVSDVASCSPVPVPQCVASSIVLSESADTHDRPRHSTEDRFNDVQKLCTTGEWQWGLPRAEFLWGLGQQASSRRSHFSPKAEWNHGPPICSTGVLLAHHAWPASRKAATCDHAPRGLLEFGR